MTQHHLFHEDKAYTVLHLIDQSMEALYTSAETPCSSALDQVSSASRQAALPIWEILKGKMERKRKERKGIDLTVPEVEEGLMASAPEPAYRPPWPAGAVGPWIPPPKLETGVPWVVPVPGASWAVPACWGTPIVLRKAPRSEPCAGTAYT